MLIITTIRNPGDKTKRLALVKSMYMLPSIICAILIAGSGVFIYLDSSTTTTTALSSYEVLDNTNSIVVLNSTVTQIETKTNYFELLNPVWVSFHYMLALIMSIFVFIQIFTMLTSKD